MEELSRFYLGKYATPKEKIGLMGEILTSPMKWQMKSDEEVREEVMERFIRLGMADRARSAQFMEDELSSEGLRSAVYLLYRHSLSLSDAELVQQPQLMNMSKSCIAGRGPIVRMRGAKAGGSRGTATSSPMTDDGCEDSPREASMATRLPSGHLTDEYYTLLKARSRANPREKTCIEVSLCALSTFICDALSGSKSFIFRVEAGIVSTVSPLFITDHSISQTRSFLRPIVNFINSILLAEQSLFDVSSNSSSDLPHLLSQIALSHLRDLREEARHLLYSRPFPSDHTIRSNLRLLMERGDQFVSIASLLRRLHQTSCAECLDSLVSSLSNESVDETLIEPILGLLRFALLKTIEDAENFMLTGAVSELGLILETPQGSKLTEEWKGGRVEGERWRKNYGIRVGYGRSIDRTTADEIMAEGKQALMRLRDPTLVEEYRLVNWEEDKVEREEEREEIGRRVRRGISARELNQIFKDSIKWIRSRGDRSIFLSRQIDLVANSLEIVWQVFLLGDRVARVPQFDGGMRDRYNTMRDAIAAFTQEHLLAVRFMNKSRGSRETGGNISLHVSGALSIVVSSSNISIYSEAFKLLSKLSTVYHRISEAYLNLPLLSRNSDEVVRGLHKALAEITHWVGKLCGYFCTQVHEVVWKDTCKSVLTSLASFDLLFSTHRRALKNLASLLLLQSSSSSISTALHASIDASSDFCRFLEGREWERAAESYTHFIEAAQMFTHGLIVDEDSLGNRLKLLFLIDPFEKFRM